MEGFEVFLLLGTGLLMGAGALFAASSFVRLKKQAAAKLAAETTIANARKRAEAILKTASAQAAEFETRLKQRAQKEVAQKQQRLNTQEQDVRALQAQHDRHFAELEKQFQTNFGPWLNRHQACLAREQSVRTQRESALTLRNQLIGRAEQLSSLNRTDILQSVISRLVEDGSLQAKKRLQLWEEDFKLRSEQTAHQILGTVLARFMRPYCSERGIGIVAIPNETVKQNLLARDREPLRRLSELCGVDLTIQDNNTVHVSGFDPVRRELTNRCLEKMMVSRDLSPTVIGRIFEDCKKDLFRKIQSDGQNVCRELHIENMHPEIQRMLGSLRYRYSFAQNQYFHVAEVGWLCGLLSAEIGEKITDGRRAGLLHDVGKAMDHSIEGGHAVIGADFISQHGEQAHIVHAVRAHHFEEQPSTDLAFLVIAADAISGSRPGARRSTVTAYNQKMEALEHIAAERTGVLRTLVFNAGREVRLLVDSARVSDHEALKLCQDVAQRIENELAYPGTIKVVVVRETVADAMAR